MVYFKLDIFLPPNGIFYFWYTTLTLQYTEVYFLYKTILEQMHLKRPNLCAATGQLSWEGYSETQPCQIYSRLYNLLKEKTKALDPVSTQELHEYVKDIVDDSTLTNWSENRSIPDLEIIYRLADYLGTSLPFLLANITGSMIEHPGINGEKISLEEYNDFCNYKKN